MKRTAELIALLGAVMLLGACHTMRFDIGNGRAVEEVYERKSFFLFGLVPTRVVNVGAVCPAGVVAVREEITFLDGLFANLTLGIWTPRSSWYYCGTGEGS